MENNTVQIYVERLNADTAFLFKNDSRFKELVLEISNLPIESLSVLLKSLENFDYINIVVRLVIKYKLGKIKEFKTELNEACSNLYRQKKYSRIKQIKSILSLLEIDISNYNNFESRIFMRMNGANFSTYYNECEFNDVINNANLYLKNDSSKTLFYKKAEIFPLYKFLEATFKSFDGKLEADSFLAALVQLYKYSGEERLRKIIEESYRDRKIEISKIKRFQTTKKEDVNYSHDQSSIININVDKHEVKQKIFELKSDLYADDINKEHFSYVLQELIFCYEKLNEKESALKLREYLSLKSRVFNE